MGHCATRPALLCIAGIMIFANLAGLGLCECCGPMGLFLTDHPSCGDYTYATPCCGYGRCNIFCCNCDGGCRNAPRYALGNSLGNSSVLVKDVFLKMDRNGDGFVDKEEARTYVVTDVFLNHSEEIVDFEDGFKKLDKLGNGKLSLAEIDDAKTN